MHCKGEHNINFNKSSGRKRKIIVSVLLIQRALFGGMQYALASSNSTNFQDGVNSKTEMSRVLENKCAEGSAQPEQVMKSSQTILKIPPGGDGNSSQPSQVTEGSTPKKKKSILGGSYFAEAFEPNSPARPGGNKGGLFGRFTPKPAPDPSNPGCAIRPRSITVLSGQRNSDESTKLTARDGFEARLTDKSENHLTSKHGHAFGVDDPLPRNPNQKPTKYDQPRT